MNNEVFNLNSEMLLIMEAKMANPNGDPDNENRPRIDPRTGINYVSDVRLKRYIRDFIIERYGEDKIWVTKLNGKNVTPTERMGELKPSEVNSFFDARIFGSTIPIKKGEEEERGQSYFYTGPVQFSWATSLHPVDIIDSPTISSQFVGREKNKGANEHGTFGKDYRVYYSMYAYYGVISGARAKFTGMTNSDVEALDSIIFDAILNESITRSKIGITPILYLRTQYKDNTFLLGDLRDLIDVNYNEPVRSRQDVKIQFERLINMLNENKDDIEKVIVSGIFEGEISSGIKNSGIVVSKPTYKAFETIFRD